MLATGMEREMKKVYIRCRHKGEREREQEAQMEHKLRENKWKEAQRKCQ